MEQIEMDNNLVCVKPIFAKTSSKSNLIAAGSGLPLVAKSAYVEHPFRALVLFCGKYFYNGGIRYESEIKVGDIVYLPGRVVMDNNDPLIIEGIEYPTIKYGLILGHRTPTEEERNSLSFKAEEAKSNIEVVGQPIAQA